MPFKFEHAIVIIEESNNLSKLFISELMSFFLKCMSKG